MTSKEFGLLCIAEFMRVALGPDPVRHGCDLSDVAEAHRFKRALAELSEIDIARARRIIEDAD